MHGIERRCSKARARSNVRDESLGLIIGIMELLRPQLDSCSWPRSSGKWWVKGFRSRPEIAKRIPVRFVPTARAKDSIDRCSTAECSDFGANLFERGNAWWTREITNASEVLGQQEQGFKLVTSDQPIAGRKAVS